MSTPTDRPSEGSEEARRFQAILEETGQLVDVKENDDTSKLPPKVTHVRYPDGRVKRIRFTSFGGR